MNMAHHRGGWVILMSFIVAMMLAMLPLPEWSEYARPEWATMVLIYWCMALPNRVGVGIGWLTGLFLDVIHGAVLGQYALALALIAYFTLTLHRRLRVYPLVQQSLVVMMLILLQQLLITWIKGFLGQPPDSLAYWLPSLTSMLLWAWVFIILRDLRRHFRVS
jgi:rod shape-determining protein MreD